MKLKSLKSTLIWTGRLSSSLVWRTLARRGRLWAGEPVEDGEKRRRWWNRGIRPWNLRILSIAPAGRGLWRRLSACCGFALRPHLFLWRSQLLWLSDTVDIYKKQKKKNPFFLTHYALTKTTWTEAVWFVFKPVSDLEARWRLPLRRAAPPPPPPTDCVSFSGRCRGRRRPRTGPAGRRGSSEPAAGPSTAEEESEEERRKTRTPYSII